MFEKEADKYIKKDGTKAEQILNALNEISPLKITLKQLPFILAMLEQAFKDGAEVGYNKANEWHFVKDGDLPPKKLEEKPILVRVRRYAEEWFIAYYMLDGYNRKNGKRFYADTDQEFSINIKDVIAWKEVVLPKEEENVKSDN